MRQSADIILEKAIRLARVIPHLQTLTLPALAPATIATRPRCASQHTPEIHIDDWVERQKAIPFPVSIKEPWFSIVGEIEPRRPLIEDIQRVVASSYAVSRSDLMSARRTANVVRPRQVAMYLAKTLTLRSLPEIGRRFGGRDHTTVLHAVRKISALVANDAAASEHILDLTQTIEGRAST